MIFICILLKNGLYIFLSSDYKGLLEGCNIVWTCDWTSEALLNSADYFFAGNPHIEEIDESLRQVNMDTQSIV